MASNVLAGLLLGLSMLLNTIETTVNMHAFPSFSAYCSFREHMALFINGMVLFHNFLIYFLYPTISFLFIFLNGKTLSLPVLLEYIDDLCLIIFFKMKYLGLVFFYPNCIPLLKLELWMDTRGRL